jgi:hypothetical protein
MLKSYCRALQLHNNRCLESTHALLLSQARTLSCFLNLVPPTHPQPGHTSFDSSLDIITASRSSSMVPSTHRRRGRRPSKHDKHIFSYLTPTCWLGKVWEVHLKRSYSGWTVSLSSVIITPRDSLAYQYAAEGDLIGLQLLFETREASPYERNPDGKTAGWFRKHNWGAYRRGAQFDYPRVGTLMIHLCCDYYGHCLTHFIGAN